MSVIKFKKKEIKCNHNSASIDRANKTVVCRLCGESLNTFDWLVGYCDELERVHKEVLIYADKAEQQHAKNALFSKRLSEKKRTKCKSCGEFTPVNVKFPTIFDVREQERSEQK